MRKAKAITKKLSANLYFLLATTFFTCAFADDDANYAKTVTGDGGVRYSLAKNAKSMMHVFDAMPKMRIYKYTGTEATKYFGKGDRGNDKTPHGRVIYPQHVSSQDNYALEYNLPTANESSMLVTLYDWDLADVDAKKQHGELVAEFKKMNIPVPPFEGGSKAKMLASHHEMFTVALASKSLDEFKVSTRFADIDEAYVAYRADESYFTGVIKKRYSIMIKINGVYTLKSTDDVEEYIASYVSKLSLKGLSPPILDK